MGDIPAAQRSTAVVLVYKLPEGISVSGSLCRQWELPNGYFWNKNGDILAARRSTAVVLVHKLPEGIS